MTEQEKNMKRYLTAIRRRLNLPREVKNRVITDLESSIAARREAGQTDELIRAELGSPKTVAAELMEQMKEYAYTKSRWRWAALAASVFAGLMLLFEGLSGLLTWLLNLSLAEEGSMGIIGGADGPTVLFVTSGWTAEDMVPWLLLLLMGLVGWFGLSHMKQK